MYDNHYIIYGRTDPPCPWCKRAIHLLESRGLEYDYEDISNPEILEFFQMMGWKTVPQIELFEDGNIHHIGGYEELKEHLNGKEA